MDRRTFIKAAAIAASTPVTMGAISMTIPEMFQEWLAVRNRDISDMTDEEAEAGYQQYVSLQARIIASEPQTPQDVAIMFIVDTDYTGSDFSNEFVDRMERLALA